MDGRSGAGGGSCGVVDRGEWTGRGGNGEYGATAITNLSRVRGEYLEGAVQEKRAK